MVFAGIIFTVLLVLVVLGVPILMVIAGTGLVGLVYAGFNASFYIVPQQVLEGVNSPALLAVPFFILAGNLLTVLGIADRIYNFANALVGHFRAGLAQVNVVGSMVFAGVSGAAISDLGTLGRIEIKAMVAHGYRPDFSAAITGASSVVGPIIPPSIPLVIYGVTASTSIGRLFLAGLIPGISAGLGLMLCIRLLAIRHNFPIQSRMPLAEIVRSAADGLVALGAPALILGAMLTGYSTATEAGVLASVYSLIVGLFYRTLTWKKLWEALTETVLLTSFVLMMIGFATVIGWLLAIEQIPQQLASLVLDKVSSPWGFLAVYLVFFLLLGCVFDTLAAMIILMPIVLPVVDHFGIDRVHFGVLTVFVLTIGILLPPVGLALYVLVNISGVPFDRIVRAVLPLLIPLIAVLVLVTYVPALSLWLPNLVMGAN